MQDRKIIILDATLSLLARKGLAQLTHRAVDSEAGLPQGSTSYYFSKKAHLIESAALHMARQMEEDCSVLKQQFAELIAEGRKDEALEHVAEDILRFAKEKKMWLLARLELSLAGARDKSLSPAAGRISAAVKEPIGFFLKLLSADITDEQIETCAGILDGLALSFATGHGPEPNKEQLKRLFLTA